jgi:MoaA/NifB/PqqE/SkfB family radical SAM enzyme
MQKDVMLVTGWKAKLIRSKVKWFIIFEAFRLYRNPFLAVSEMKKLRNLRGQVHGNTIVSKYVKSGKRYFWTSDYCGFPSDKFKCLIRNEFIRNNGTEPKVLGVQPILQTLIWGITNRCPLSCQHCYEWDTISQKDSLDLVALEEILAIFKTNGIRHIQFSGGEPVARFNDLVVLIVKASISMDCWLLTSGFGLNAEKAKALKKAGLTGVNISLDHWDAELHNRFRNNDKSFSMVTEAVQNCVNEGIMVSLSLCATRDFVTEENLMNYALLAKNFGAHFIRILEPRAVGKFSGQNVQLENNQVKMLSEFTVRMNTDPLYKDFPIVVFFGYHQRKMGCFGAGNRYVYIDPNGNLHACPFCRGKMGNILETPFSDIIAKVKTIGCHQFENIN